MDRRWLMSRRTLLGGLGLAGASAMLPRSLRRHAAAADTAPPTRFVVVHVPEGMWSGAQRPSSSGTTLGPLLQPLDPYRDKLTVLNGLNMKSRDHGPGGDGHHRGVPHMITGTEMLDEGNAGGASVDQKIAAAIGGSSTFKSLQFAVRIIYGDTNSRPLWSAPGRVVPAAQDPWEVYNRVFAGVMPKAAPSPTPTATKLDLRRSALDYVLADTKALSNKLSVSDRQRVESYQDSLRDIETRLAAAAQPAPAPASCAPPTLGSKVDIKSEANYPMIGKLQTDLLIAAMQCGSTRVASLQWGNSNDQCSYPWLGVNNIGHDLAHNNNNCDPSGSKKATVTKWYAEQFAYMLGKLQSIPEGTGNMLDNTLILWISEFSECNGHSADNLMWTLMGNAAGYFRQGRVLSMNGRATNDLLATICNAFGITDKTFGNPAYGSGPITDLVA